MDLTTQKHIFGFDKGYIWLVENSLYAEEDPVLRESSARFCVRWGWYFYADPDVLPDEYHMRKLIWDEVGNSDGSLKDIMLYPENTAGKVGDRIELNIKVLVANEYETHWNKQHIYDMIDEDGQMFRWTTAAKDWEEGSSHHIRGTIKEFDKGVCVLTRCMEK